MTTKSDVKSITVIARHERDNEDLYLDKSQINRTEEEMLITFKELYKLGIVSFTLDNGWHYIIEGNEYV